MHSSPHSRDATHVVHDGPRSRENMNPEPAHHAAFTSTSTQGGRDLEVTDTIDSVTTANSFATAHTTNTAHTAETHGTVETDNTHRAGSTEKLSPAPVRDDSTLKEPDATYRSEEPINEKNGQAPPPDAGAVGQAELARTMTGGSSRPYSAFPNRTRWLIAGLGGVAAVFSPISVSFANAGMACDLALSDPTLLLLHAPSPEQPQLTARVTFSSLQSQRLRRLSTGPSRTSRWP